MKPPNPDAYVIADYLLTAATRLQIAKGSILAETREVLVRYSDGPEKDAALAFLEALESAAAFDAWKESRTTKENP